MDLMDAIDDEDSLPSLLNRIFSQLIRLAAPAAALLRQGLTRNRIAELTADLPFQLPDEVYTLYQWHDGVPSNHREAPLFCDKDTGWMFLSLEDAVASYRSNVAMAQDVAGDDWQNVWHPRCFPLFESDEPSSLCVLGQDTRTPTAPILYVHLEGATNDEEYVSLTLLARIVARCYEAGAFSVAEAGALQADAALMASAIRRRSEPARSDAALQTLRNGHGDPAFAKALNDIITFHDIRAVEPLLALLEQSNYADDGVIVTLAEIGDERVVEPLLRAVREGPTLDEGIEGISAKWAEALHYMDAGGLRRSTARGAAIQSLLLMAERLHLQLPAAPFAAALRDPLTYVRQGAVWALEQIGTPEAREALLIALRDPDDYTCQMAEDARYRLWRPPTREN